MGIVSKYIHNLIAKQLNDNGIVVWYDPKGAWSDPKVQMNNLEKFYRSINYLWHACRIP